MVTRTVNKIKNRDATFSNGWRSLNLKITSDWFFAEEQVLNLFFYYYFSTTEALKKVLEYDYMESKDDEQDDENAQAQDDGKTQEGCGLGDGDAAQATTSDVTSEDMFDSAEKPKPDEVFFSRPQFKIV